MAELHHPHAHPAAKDLPIHHESSDVNFGGIIGFGIGLVVVGVAMSILVFVLFRFFDARARLHQSVEYPLAMSQGARLPPEPRLQTNPREDLRELRAKEDELLGSYGWVDKNAGVVRIPIDAAMKLTLERGLPARTEQKR
jgi:hypothetical protein